MQSPLVSSTLGMRSSPTRMSVNLSCISKFRYINFEYYAKFTLGTLAIFLFYARKSTHGFRKRDKIQNFHK